MEPVIKKSGSGYEVAWPSQGVHARVRHIKNRGDRFKAQVAITFREEPVHRSDPTLNSVTGLDQFARKLERRIPQEQWGVDWELIVEGLAGIVQDTHASGTGEVELGTVVPDETAQWSVDNLVIQGQANLIYGDGGTGKSMFCLWIAALMDQGHVNTDHGLVIEPGKVLYLDWETDASEVSTRVRNIHAGLGITNDSGIVYRAQTLPLAQDQDRIQDIVDERGIDLVIVDSMGMAVEGELESAETVLSFFRAVRTIGKTALIISHVNRQGTIFGSAYTNNSARNVWEASKAASTVSSNEKDIAFNLFHKKANNINLQPSQSWSMSFDDDKVLLERGEVYETTDAGKLSIPKLVKEILKREGPRTKDSLDEMVAIKMNIDIPREGEDMSGQYRKLRSNVGVAISRMKNPQKETDSRIAELPDGTLSISTPTAEGGEAWQDL